MNFRLAPVARTIALTLATGAAVVPAHAQSALGAGWMAQKNLMQSTALATGRLPNGMAASMLTNPQGQSQQARAQLQRSVTNLGLAAQAIAAQQAAQAAARQAALSGASDVPDGLADGGLKVDTNSLTAGWLNANAPVQSSSGGRTQVEIQQTADKAILNWQTFNVGRNTTVQFDQQPSWAVLNRVNDPNARPSQIRGQIKGAGTVLIVNRNGIVFSGSSQIDVRNLVAAAARIGDDQFTTAGIYSTTASGSAYTPSFTDAAGIVSLEAGAQINTQVPGSVTQGGGYALLLGQQVGNAGTITTPRGQAQLAAGDFFIVRPGQGTQSNQYATTRGNEVAPQFNPGSTAGSVANTGLLMAPEGDITLAGRHVLQDGVAVSTTTVDTRGTIHLLTSAADAQGSVVVTGRAVNAILLDDKNGATALDSQRDALITESAAMDLARINAAPGVFDNLSRLNDRRDESRIEIVSGGGVQFDGGSTTLATGGQIAVSAGNSRVAADARLDVSGAVGVQVSMESNNVEINIQGNEQRDAPLNRDTTLLNNSNVWIDRRKLVHVAAGVGGYDKDRWYTAGGLLEVGGYLGLQGHGIGEWAASGGSVTFAGGKLVTEQGSNINLAGGTLDVATGVIRQSWLKGADGQLYEVSSAPGDIVYTGLYKGFEDDHKRWGDETTAFFRSPLIAPEQRLENGYTVGRDAGQLIIATSAAQLDGDITATAFQGPRQTQKGDPTLDSYAQSQSAAAQAAQLILGSYTTAANSNPNQGPLGIFHNLVPTLDQIVFGADPAAIPEGASYFSSERLDSFGLGSILAAASGSITVDAALAVVPGGAIALHAPKVTANANLTARSGSIELSNFVQFVTPNNGAFSETVLAAPAGQGEQMTVGRNVTLDARGLWSNLLLDASDVSGLPYIDGGTVTVRSTGGVLLDAGSLVDVSSGAALMADGSLQGGKGGNVTLAAGAPGSLAGVTGAAINLQLLGTLRAYGVNGGGTLDIESGTAIGIDGQLLPENGLLQANATAPVNLRLTGDYALAAGDVIPVDFSLTVTHLDPGQAAPRNTPSDGPPLVTHADWIVPPGNTLLTSIGQLESGAFVPAGTTITHMYNITAGFVVPADVFPDGIQIAPQTTNYAAGSMAATAMTIPAGTLIPAGKSFVQAVAVKPVESLDSALFHTGFSQYEVTGRDGLIVADGAAIDVSMPVLRWSDAAPQLPTGSDPAQALERWTPPLYLEDPVHARLAQRGGASLSLVAGELTDITTNEAPLVVGHGTTISVDPGSDIVLRGSGGQLTVDGTLNAWGGSIAISSMTAGLSTYHNDPARSVWIGEDAVLDAAARAYVAHDNQGRAYGVAPDGGSIELGLSDGFLVIRPGALLDASGSTAAIDLSAGGNANAPAQPLMLAGAGGNIGLHSYVGMYLDGEMRAHAGGAGAAGGTLTVEMNDRLYNPVTEAIGDDVQTLHSLTLVQDRRASVLPDDLAPGQANASMVVGQGLVSVAQIKDGGFDDVTLAAHDLLVFEGDIDLAVGRSLDLRSPTLVVSDATPNAQVRFQAPYVRLDTLIDPPAPAGYYVPGFFSAGPATRTAGDSALSISADLIDIAGTVQSGVNGTQGAGVITPGFDGRPAPRHPVDLASFSTVSLESQGDIRVAGRFSTSSDMLITAAQIYPVSGKAGTLYAWSIAATPDTPAPPPSVLQIRSNGQPAPMPDSVFGTLSLVADTVDQGGIVRAPLGTISINDSGSVDGFTPAPLGTHVILRSGSLTSVSADGLAMPFGGTSDNLNYRGADGTFFNLGTSVVDQSGVLPQGITIGGNSIVGEPGAVLDLSGGGELRGAGFITGRGGSVDVLTTPLANVNPLIYGQSQGGNKVYAVVPGRASNYAPVIADKGAGDPAIGQQIEIGAGVPGLPAGTYTLLPASYALMPGAWRVELGGHVTASPASAALPGGSWMTEGTLKTAGTSVRDALPTQLIFTPADTVRQISQYNETSYADFAVAQAALFGNVRPRLPEDGKILRLNFTQDDDAQALQFDGIAKFAGVGDGISGQLMVTADTSIDITGPHAAPAPGVVSLGAGDLDAFGAGSMFIGGYLQYFSGLSNEGDGARLYVTHYGLGNSVHVRDGADLKASQIFLIAPDVAVDGGATLDTRGMGLAGVDSSLGYVYANNLKLSQQVDGPAMLIVANGWLDLLPSQGSGKISVGDGANLLTEGTIGFASPAGLDLGHANLGARYLTVSQDQINIGSADSLAAAQAAGVLPGGWQLTQDVLDRLLHPSDSSGVPALERLSLTAGGAFNFFGSVTLDTGDSQAQLVLNTPAFHGWGTSADVVRLATDTLVWNGVASGSGTNGDPYVSTAPTAVVPGGAGTGSGQLVIDANTVMFGYDALSRPQTQATLGREALGFAGVTVHGADRITANSRSALTTPGDLTLDTPLLTGEAGSVMNYTAGGALRVTTPAGAKPGDTSAVDALGGSVTLKGQSVSLDTAVALPSGKLSVEADGDIALGDNAFVDLAGRGVAFFDVTKYSWGGDVSLQSTNGSIGQSAGSVIDVSAANNDAGSLSAKAEAGAVNLAGALRGKGGEGHSDGQFTLQTKQLDGAAFAALNDQLNTGGFFGSRDFTVKQGDLTVGDGVHAHEVSISVDSGSLVVNGTIDASGERVGSISLAAQNDLTLTGSALLDVHATKLVTDSDGAPIEASNRAQIALTSVGGTLTLADGSRMDLSTPDGVARGHVELNAQRRSADGVDDHANDIAIDAGGNVKIAGASSIAVNGFRTYTLGPADIVDQDYLNGIDTSNRNFINAAWDNTELQGRLAGLKAYGDAYHLRPGVELKSDGDITTQGDIDLSAFRYGPNADPSERGSGEPGLLVLRAAGNLNINGSITDGFASPGASPDDNGWGVLLPQGILTAPLTVSSPNVVLAAFSTLPITSVFNVDFVLTDDPNVFGLSTIAIKPGTVIPTDAHLYTVSFGSDTVATAPVYDAADGTTVLYQKGQTIPAGTFLSNVVLGAGFNVGSADMALASMKVPAGTRLDSLFDSPLFITDIWLTADTALPAGIVIPTGASLSYVGSNFIPSRPTGPDGTQGKMWANAPMLAPGLQSWSMRLVGGADLGSADSRALQSAQQLAGSGNVVLNDPHAVGMALAPGMQTAALSVLRTGTGDLEILAGGNYTQESLFGVYTAGTAIDAAASAPYDLPRSLLPDGTVLGAAYAAYEPLLNAQRMWFTEGGGNLTLAAQGNITGYQDANAFQIGDWLLRQGGDELGQKTAWGINFGTYAEVGNGTLGQAGFSGVGALGGGRLDVRAGGDIGGPSRQLDSLVLAVAGSGRVAQDAGGKTLLQTGGGDLRVSAGGELAGDLLVDLRGDTVVHAGSLGSIALASYGSSFSGADPRLLNAQTAYSALNTDAVGFAPGDGTVTVNTLGDLSLAALIDPTRVGTRFSTQATQDGQAGAGQAWFTLWRDDTAVDAFSAGGSVTPFGSLVAFDTGAPPGVSAVATRVLPPILRVAAAGGSIYLSADFSRGQYLMPSPEAQLELLASNMVVGNLGNGDAFSGTSSFGLLGTSQSTLATPMRAAWIWTNSNTGAQTSNYWGDMGHTIDGADVYRFGYQPDGYWAGPGGTPFMFGPNTVTDNSEAGNGTPTRIYAVDGDVIGMWIGEADQLDSGASRVTYYYGSKPVRILAGGDVVNTRGLFVHGAPTDVSMVAAGGSVLYADLSVAGPGTLEVTAGKQVYQGDQSSLVSLGGIEIGDMRPGADIAVQAGFGAGLPGQGASDFARFASLYLDPANQIDPSRALADQPGKVVKTYQVELAAWLAERFGYEGSDALGYFESLPAEQQRIFVREVFYDELTAGGREYNDPDSKRFGSYLRGRDAIATLFPSADVQGDAIQREGDITLYQGVAHNAGVRTVVGGSIQTLTPGGATVVGVEGITPASGGDITPAGLITQGAGDIDMYSEGSILLGLSRIMTTFGGDILGWSATGDINAGRGSKTTLVYTPPKREYDDYGNVKLSPNVPSTGAGIATLDPIPEIPPGDVDLIAPLGVIDAGEAGIRVSGNVNLAALQVVNAANIEVKGESKGLPVVASVNTNALSSASAAASQATMAAQDVVQQQKNAARQALPSIFTVQVLGFGNELVDGDTESRPSRPELQSGVKPAAVRYDATNPVQFVGLGGKFNPRQLARLTEEERRALQDR